MDSECASTGEAMEHKPLILLATITDGLLHHGILIWDSWY